MTSSSGGGEATSDTTGGSGQSGSGQSGSGHGGPGRSH
jgi:hypothetical protein